MKKIMYKQKTLKKKFHLYLNKLLIKNKLMTLISKKNNGPKNQADFKNKTPRLRMKFWKNLSLQRQLKSRNLMTNKLYLKNN